MASSEGINMTTDEEITIEEKFWQAHFVVCQNAPAKEDGRKIMLEAAVMMATKLIAETRASERKQVQLEWAISLQEELKLARADERRKCQMTYANLEDQLKEAYARGLLAGQHSKTAYKLGKLDGPTKKVM